MTGRNCGPHEIFISDPIMTARLDLYFKTKMPAKKKIRIVQSNGFIGLSHYLQSFAR